MLMILMIRSHLFLQIHNILSAAESGRLCEMRGRVSAQTHATKLNLHTNEILKVSSVSYEDVYCIKLKIHGFSLHLYL